MTVARSFTPEDLLELGDSDGRFELVRGELIEMSPSSAKRGYVVAQIGHLLMNYLDDSPMGRLFSGDVGFVLERNPSTVRGPGLAFVSSNRLPAQGLPDGFFEGPADLAVEVRSRFDGPGDIDRKVREYLSASARLVWVVNPE